MLLLREGASVPEAVRLLEKAGVSPVWSAASQTVYLTNFVSSSRVPLEEALKRVLPEDPRHTPWLDGLARFYRAEDGTVAWNILYVPASEAARARRAVERQGAASDWIVSGAGARGSVLFGLPGVLLALFIAARSGRARYFMAAAAVPWLPLWFSGRPAAALAGLLGYCCVASLGAENEYEPGRILPAFGRDAVLRALPSTASFVLLCLSDPKSLAGCLAAASSAGCVIVGFENFHRRRAELRTHKVFWGPPLDRRARRREKDEGWRLRALAALAAAAAVMAVSGVGGILGRSAGVPGADGGLRLPSPAGTAGPRGLDGKAVERIVRGEDGSLLPNLADAVAHRAYQEALPYSRIGLRPYGSLEPVVLEKYKADGASVVRTLETVAEFGETWVRETVREERREGIGAVLGDQRGISKAALLPVREIRNERSLALKGVFFYIILLAPAGWGMARLGFGTRRAFYRLVPDAARR